MRSRKKRAGRAAFHICVILLFMAAGVGALRVQYMQKKDKQTNDSYEKILNDETKKQMVSVYGIEPIKTAVTDETACVEMLASWKNKHVTEEVIKELDKGPFFTSSDYLLKQMNTYLGQYKTVCYSNVKNSELLEHIYENLKKETPVMVSLALKNESNTFYRPATVIVTRMDAERGLVYFIHPEGYEMSMDVDSFLKATRYDYEVDIKTKSELLTGVLCKNTIFIMKKI